MAQATLYKGDLHLDALSGAGLPTGERLAVNATELKLTPATSNQLTQQSTKLADYGSTLTSIRLPGNPAIVSITADGIPEDQLDLWLSGSQSTLTQASGTAVAFEVIASLDRWVKLGDHVELSALTLTTPAEKTLGTDYEVDYQGARIRALSTGTIAQGATLTGTYNHAAVTGGIVHGGYVISRPCYMYLKGYDMGKLEKVLLDVWQADLEFGEATPMGSGLMSITASGPMITPAGKVGPYRIRHWS